MSSEDMIARLVEQSAGGGFGAGGDLVTIRALVEEASSLGAGHALDRLGLSDRAAAQDMRELRELLRAWRDAKATARSAAIGWLVRGALALMLIGMAAKLGLLELVRA